MFALTSYPNPPLPAGLPRGTDKVTHMALYGVLSYLIARAFRTNQARAIGISTIVVIASIGAFDEWHQTFIPGRSGEVADWSADLAGGVAGCLLAWALTRRELRS